MNTLPPAIAGYLSGADARFFTADAVVRDDGHTYRGTEEIRDWLGRVSGEYTWTATPTGSIKLDDLRYEVRQHLEGDFPGGVVDLRYRFTLRGDLVSELVIEP
ncbi:nuclear transport factor 2 family protein [Asanoa iriomotensis]|uniref:SnoaL-like protein n=1 Tax=Asanoa iriomotensis TaxID=234613 RepID=A0ABQ4C0C2_9ACTN|nr:nuclear transport factor 2 family protein [Asanoa iriomotensis]GIF56223.1 hypothetical protein Air01nite_23180 [Asanoa iriomotensis]